MGWLPGRLVVLLVLGGGLAVGWMFLRSPGPEEGAVQPPAPAAPGERVRVEVLNGGGLEGAARRATEQLRDAGFDVVLTGNADDFGQDSSVVYARMGNPEWAEAVAKALGIPNVESRPDTNLYVDVSVVLGRDWVGAEHPGETAEPSTR